MYNRKEGGCDFQVVRCPLVLKEGDAHGYIRSAYFIISNFCGSVIHRQS